MDRDRTRVLGLTVAYVALVVVSAFFLDWFVLRTPSGRFALDLRNATVCHDGSACSRLDLGEIPQLGPYVYGAWLSFWGSLVLSLLVLFQAGSRVFTGFGHQRLSRMGMLAGMGMLANAGATGFIFTPEAGPMGDVLDMSFSRTIAPWLMVLGHAVGILALFYAAFETNEDDVGEYKPVVLNPTSDRFPLAATPGAETARASARPGSNPGTTSTSGLLPLYPPHLKKRLKFLALSAELTRAGIDARREEGGPLLVMWADVVGVIVRRLPPELDGETFVDLVSTEGSTLRVLPWTRFTGEPLLGTGEARARAFVTFVTSHCPEARLDPATRAFVEYGEPAEQLASADDLAFYDARLG